MKVNELISKRHKEELKISAERGKEMAKVLEEFLSGVKAELQGKTILIFSAGEDGGYSLLPTGLKEIMEKGETAGVVKIIKVKDVEESDKEAIFDCIDGKNVRHHVFDSTVLAEII